MVLNNVTKFKKILIKIIRLREPTLFGQRYVRIRVGIKPGFYYKAQPGGFYGFYEGGFWGFYGFYVGFIN